MELLITNPTNGHMTVYKPADLRREARSVARNAKLPMQSAHVEISANGPRLVVTVRQPDGWCRQITHAI